MPFTDHKYYILKPNPKKDLLCLHAGVKLS